MNETVLRKLAQAIEEEQKKRKAPRRRKPEMKSYPDYTRSLISQRKEDPMRAGAKRGLQTGALGSILGALIARVVSNRPSAVASGALAGGVMGAVPGFVSGHQEAKSDYGKVLFLRRRMGINEPGELETLLQNPELAHHLIRKHGPAGSVGAEEDLVKSSALGPNAVKVLKGLAIPGGLAGGWLAGTEGTSRAFGYHDDPAARHLGGSINAATLATLLGLLAHKPGAFGHLIQAGGLKTFGSVAGLELAPVAVKTMRDSAAATRAGASGQVAPTLSRLLNSGAGRGAAAGAGVAGLGGLATGLMRPKTDEELAQRKSRGSMVAKDMLKYLLPALIGGGVVGSLAKPRV